LAKWIVKHFFGNFTKNSRIRIASVRILEESGEKDGSISGIIEESFEESRRFEATSGGGMKDRGKERKKRNPEIFRSFHF